ncbi:AtzH-like domain-containing protein [Micromonospora wenchangensis]
MGTPDEHSATDLRAGAADGLMDAFWAYERALMTDDLDALDRLFAPGPATLRGDTDGLLVGHDRIRDFRQGRGGAPPRRVVRVHVRPIDADHALVVAVTEPERGGRGLQTQLWQRAPAGWVVSAAHVTLPVPALDTRIWRVVGDPLVPATAAGALTGQSVAVKDLYAVAGQRVGAGNPARFAAARPEPRHAVAVEALLAAGADLRGIARTDEFAYSLAGTNVHTGTAPNPQAPGRISGGSSSGPASAVSLGHATIGLGTDTGGSIRVPASYQGLFGFRPTHGVVSTDGVLPLAPSFDTVGWLTRDAALLATVGDVLLPPAPDRACGEAVVVPELLALAHPEVAAAVEAYARDRAGGVRESWQLTELPAWLTAFQTRQAWEAWQAHGEWLAPRLHTLGADVRGRFEMASRVSEDDAARAAEQVAVARRRIRETVGDRVLVLPSASSVAPRVGQGLTDIRHSTMQLTCLAGIGGLPAVSVPTATADGLPCGVCLIAPADRDRDLLRLAAELAVAKR